jgi:hypothetical protein
MAIKVAEGHRGDKPLLKKQRAIEGSEGLRGNVGPRGDRGRKEGQRVEGRTEGCREKGQRAIEGTERCRGGRG